MGCGCGWRGERDGVQWSGVESNGEERRGEEVEGRSGERMEKERVEEEKEGQKAIQDDLIANFEVLFVYEVWA